MGNKLFYSLFILVVMNNVDLGAQNFSIKSTSFLNNQFFGRKYTAYGENVSPQLILSNIPAKTKSLILIVEDPDARKVVGKTFIHFIGQLNPNNNEIEENQLNSKAISMISNDSGSSNYYGPKPPDKTGVHSYYFTAVALNEPFNVQNHQADYFRDTWNKQSRFYKDHKENILGFAHTLGKYKFAA